MFEWYPSEWLFGRAITCLWEVLLCDASAPSQSYVGSVKKTLIIPQGAILPLLLVAEPVPKGGTQK